LTVERGRVETQKGSSVDRDGADSGLVELDEVLSEQDVVDADSGVETIDEDGTIVEGVVESVGSGEVDSGVQGGLDEGSVDTSEIVVGQVEHGPFSAVVGVGTEGNVSTVGEVEGTHFGIEFVSRDGTGDDGLVVVEPRHGEETIVVVTDLLEDTGSAGEAVEHEVGVVDEEVGVLEGDESGFPHLGGRSVGHSLRHFFLVSEASDDVVFEVGQGESDARPAGGNDGGIVAQGVACEIEVDEVEEARSFRVTVENLSAHVEIGVLDSDLIEDSSGLAGSEVRNAGRTWHGSWANSRSHHRSGDKSNVKLIAHKKNTLS